MQNFSQLLVKIEQRGALRGFYFDIHTQCLWDSKLNTFHCLTVCGSIESMRLNGAKLYIDTDKKLNFY